MTQNALTVFTTPCTFHLLFSTIRGKLYQVNGKLPVLVDSFFPRLIWHYESIHGHHTAGYTGVSSRENSGTSRENHDDIQV
jgi:hypothetical protein